MCTYFNPNKGGGGGRHPPSRYASAISRPLEIMSSPLVRLLISKPLQSTDKLSFEIFWHKFEKNAIEDKWSESVLTKKSEKFDFFQFFFK